MVFVDLGYRKSQKVSNCAKKKEIIKKKKTNKQKTTTNLLLIAVLGEKRTKATKWATTCGMKRSLRFMT